MTNVVGGTIRNVTVVGTYRALSLYPRATTSGRELHAAELLSTGGQFESLSSRGVAHAAVIF